MDDKLKEAWLLLVKSGYQFYRNKIWKEDPQFVAVRKKVKDRKIAGIPDDRCFFLLEAARKLNVPGDVVECGARHGRSTLYLASGTTRGIEVFDSFEGLSAPGEEDGDSWRAGDCLASIDEFEANLSGFAHRISVHKGWIPDTLKESRSQQIALLHLDLDLYGPTLAALTYFWPRIVKGGLVICDDYGSTLCPGARAALDEFFANKTEKPLGLPTAQCIVTKLD